MTVMPDANMVNGQTYTFSFNLNNWFFHPDPQTLVADLQNWGPQYLSAVIATWPGNVNPASNVLAVTFTYIGDGSDVIADAAQEFITAFKQGSNDDFSFATADVGSGSSCTILGTCPTDPTQSSTCSLTNLQACLPGTTTTTMLVVAGLAVLLLVAFLSPGGQSLAIARSTR
jgi:hypothetical protein